MTAIKAHENQEAVIDLPGAFIHAECNEDVLMIMEGRLAKLMAMTESKIYIKYVTKNRNIKSIFYVKLHMVLYEMLKRTLLFHKKLLSSSMAQDFMLNSYDP